MNLRAWLLFVVVPLSIPVLYPALWFNPIGLSVIASLSILLAVIWTRRIRRRLRQEQDHSD